LRGAWWSARDPRARLVYGILLTTAVLAAPVERVIWFLVPAGALVFLVLDGTGRGRLFRGILLLGFLTILTNGFLAGGNPLGPEFLGPFRPSVRGFLLGAGQTLRLAVLASTAAALTSTLGAFDLAASLEWTVRGHQGLRRRVHGLLFPLLLALGLVGSLREETVRVLEIDRLRSGPLRPRGFRALGGILGTWMTAVVERAERLAAVLERRGYHPARPLGFARSYGFLPLDWLLCGSGVLFLVLGMA
jgi:energy-coupling factor transporter transmembrane protein EcfT